MIAHGAGDQNGLPGPRACSADVDAVSHDPDACCGYEYAVPLASLDDLGVAGDDLHTGLAGRLRHRGGDQVEVTQRVPLFDDKGR